jgi:hypothetical protein
MGSLPRNTNARNGDSAYRAFGRTRDEATRRHGLRSAIDDVQPRVLRPHEHLSAIWVVDSITPVRTCIDDEAIGRKQVGTPLGEHDDVGIE